jgi:hypothetical protein
VKGEDVGHGAAGEEGLEVGKEVDRVVGVGGREGDVAGERELGLTDSLLNVKLPLLPALEVLFDVGLGWR